MSRLRFGRLQAIPLIHGRLAFARHVRTVLLARRFAALAVELSPSHGPFVQRGLEALPRISAVFSGDRPRFLDQSEAFIGYIPIDPADGMIEALRIALGERIPVHWIDAEVDEPTPRPLVVPDAAALTGLGLEAWYEAVLPVLLANRKPNARDSLREAHMAARLQELLQAAPERGDVLLLCGLAHWEGIRAHLVAGTGKLATAAEHPPAWIRTEVLHPRSLPHVLAELPRMVYAYEAHRGGLELSEFSPERALREFLIKARELHARRFEDSVERPSLDRLQKLLDFLRKLTVTSGRLLPDAYGFAVAAKGCVGPEYALSLLAVLGDYPPNRRSQLLDAFDDPEEEAPTEGRESGGTPEDPVVMTDREAALDGEPCRVTPRQDKEPRELKPLRLPRRPKRTDASRWRAGWNPHTHCSWPPEDVVIENFRDYVSKRALTMAGIGLVKTEPFTTSMKDGLALRETLRDWHRKKIHVKEEPRVSGQVGALVLIFEEDDDGTRFPWRSTWLAEHEEESTLAFYATDPLREMIGPGIGRMHYGGCLFLFPPFPIPDVWEDLRLERARTPSERLLLAAILHGRERWIVHVGKRPARPEIRAEAGRFGKLILHLPLENFGTTTLERLRRAHVLNGQRVRDWAGRFIP